MFHRFELVVPAGYHEMPCYISDRHVAAVMERSNSSSAIYLAQRGEPFHVKGTLQETIDKLRVVLNSSGIPK